MSLFMSRKKEGKEIEDISQKISKTLAKINNVISTMPGNMTLEEFSMMKEKLLKKSEEFFTRKEALSMKEEDYSMKNEELSTMNEELFMKKEEVSKKNEKLSEFSALMKKIETSNNNIKPSIFSKRTRENIEVLKLQLAELEAFAERHGIQLDED